MVVGVTPWRTKWVAASAKMHGSTFAPEPPKIYDSFLEVLGERPAFVVIVANAPIGYRDRFDEEPRTCDEEARLLLGKRGASLHNAPSRDVLGGEVKWRSAGLDAVTATLLPRYREVAVEMSPYRQRIVYEGHPELSFYQLNKDTPLKRSKIVEEGRDERRLVLEERLPGINKVLDAEIEGVPLKHLYDASALLWTARRVSGHAAKRIPNEAEWDSEGLRMEIVY